MKFFVVLLLVVLAFANPFDSALRKGGFVFIYFYSPSCSYCMRCSQAIYENRERLVRSELLPVDIDKNPDIAGAFGVSSVPVILVVDPAQNKILASFSGLRQCLQAISYFF